jgi:hypothetical protein
MLDWQNQNCNICHKSQSRSSILLVNSINAPPGSELCKHPITIDRKTLEDNGEDHGDGHGCDEADGAEEDYAERFGGKNAEVEGKTGDFD